MLALSVDRPTLWGSKLPGHSCRGRIPGLVGFRTPLYLLCVTRHNRQCLSLPGPGNPLLYGTGLQEGQEKAAQKQQRDARKTIKKLKAEVRRKDRVLAETTSLLVLSKKLEALYGEDPDSEDN